MTFEFENIGPIKKASLEMGKLTVVCGKNNTGKTYLSYTLKSFLDNYNSQLNIDFEPQEWIDQNKSLEEKGYFELDLSSIETDINENLSTLYKENELKEYLAKVFNTNESNFDQTKIKVLNLPNIFFHKNAIKENIADYLLLQREESSYVFKVSKLKKSAEIGNISDILSDIFTNQYLQNYFFIVAERIGLNDFEKDKYRYKHIIYSSRNALNRIYNDTLSKELKSQTQFLRKNIKKISDEMSDHAPTFSEPIEENIEFINDLNLGIWRDKNSFIAKEYPHLLSFIEDFLGITYQFIEDKLMIVDRKNAKAISVSSASSSIKSLSMLYFWLKHQAEKGDFLMIDEPELSLHPENQIKLARLLVKLVNAGIKVWITTHSDYIVKELNNCLMLSNPLEGKEQMMADLGYNESDILQPDDLRMYIAHTNGTVERVGTDEFGMLKSTFDDAMIQQNENTNRLANAVSHYLEKEIV